MMKKLLIGLCTVVFLAGCSSTSVSSAQDDAAATPEASIVTKTYFNSEEEGIEINASVTGDETSDTLQSVIFSLRYTEDYFGHPLSNAAELLDSFLETFEAENLSVSGNAGEDGIEIIIDADTNDEYDALFSFLTISVSENDDGSYSFESACQSIVDGGLEEQSDAGE